MQGSPIKLFIGPVAFAILCVNCACTAQIGKARALERAERYFKNGQYDEAKIEYLKVIRSDPRDARAYARMGQMWLEEGSALRAGGFLAAALKYDEKDTASRVRLARAYSLIGQASEARKEAEAVLGQNPSDGEALTILSEMSLSPEDRSGAEQTIQRFPNRQSADGQIAHGIIALRQSNLPTAEEDFRQAIASDPKLPRAHAAMAALFLTKRDMARAEEEFRMAAELAPIRSRERLNYAEFKAGIGAKEEAKTYLKNLTSQARDFIAAWTLQARLAVADKEYDQAIALLENVFSRDPDDLDARMLRGQIYLAQNDSKKALEIFDRLDKSFPNSPSIKYQLALADLKLGNSVQAISELEQAVAANKNYVDAVLLLAQLNIRAGRTQPAIDSLMSLVKNRPDLLQAQTLLADAFLAAGRGDDAASVIREQIKRSAQPSQSYLMLGLIELRQNKIDDARRALEQAVAWDNKNALAIDQLVSLDLIDKKYAAARERADRLLQQDPNSASAYFMKAKVDLAEGKKDTGEVFAKKAIELNPKLVGPYNLLVQSYLSNGKLKDALQQINLLLARNPKAIAALTLAGLVHEKLGEYENARGAYEQVLAIDPGSTVALNNLANLYAEKFNDLSRAADLARKAHDLAPLQPNVTDTLGWIAYQQHDYQQAVQLLQDAAVKLPDNLEVQFHLGMAQYMMGNREAARTALQKALGGSGEFAWKTEANSRLASLSNASNAPSKLPPADLEKIANEKSNDPIVLVQLGDAYAAQGAADRAANAYDRALQINPQLVEATLKVAELNSGPLKNKAKALEYAKKARSLAPNDARVGARVGRIAYKAGNVSWAYNLLQASARQLPDDPDVVHDLAWAAYGQGKVGEAEEAMRRMLNMPNGAHYQADANRFLAMVQLDADDKDPTSSEGEVNTVLASDPTYLPALMLRADIQLRRGDIQSATTSYSEILRNFPDFASAQKRLAMIYADDPNTLDKAYELATKASRTLPDDPELSATVGRLNFQRKEYARAVQLLSQAEKKKPLDAKSLFYLGMAHLQLGHKTEAREALERAIKAGLPDTLAGQARSQIAELGRSSTNR